MRNNIASASAPHGRVLLALRRPELFEFSNARWPLPRIAKPPPPSVRASPARGLAPPVGRNVTNGLMARSDCCAEARAAGVARAHAATPAIDNAQRGERCTRRLRGGDVVEQARVHSDGQGTARESTRCVHSA